MTGETGLGVLKATVDDKSELLQHINHHHPMSNKKSDRDIYLSAVAAAAAAKPRSKIKIGDVGFMFRKEFDAGWFRGIVVKIRPGAEGGLDRRCYYEDGDSEDLSLSQLQNLAELDPEVIKSKPGVSPAVGAKSVDAFDFDDDDDDDEQPVAPQQGGDGHKKSKTGVKRTLERTTMNTNQIDNEKKDSSHSHHRNNHYTMISHNNNTKIQHEIESACTTLSKAEDGTTGEAGKDGFRKSNRQPKPLRRVDEVYNYEQVDIFHNRKKRSFDDTLPERQMSLHYDIPFDKAASSTLLSSPLVQNRSKKDNGADDSADDDEDWLAKVAATLGADASSLRHKRIARSAERGCTSASSDGRARGTASSRGNIADASSNAKNVHASPPLSSNEHINNEAFGMSDINSQKPIELTRGSHSPLAAKYSLPLLSECPGRSWYGCLVYHKNDGRRRVGEVIIEQNKPWVEVVMDGVLKKYHVKHLIIVPSNQFKVGDTVPSNFSLALKRGNESSALSSDQLTFWFCKKCDTCNNSRHLACQSCGSTKTASPERSIVLGEAREAMSSCTDGERVGVGVRDQPLSCASIGTNSKQKCRGKIATISEVMPMMLRKVHQSQVNELSWAIKNIEDSVLCGERTPFPLGMLFRKFFPGYGFHDGRILKVVRKVFVDSDSNEERPALVYRCKYNDEDEEDFLHHEIASLCQLYDKRNVSPEAPPRDQIPPGAVFETLSGQTIEIVCHDTPPGSKKGEGGTVYVKFHGSLKEKECSLVDLQIAIARKVAGSLGGLHSTSDGTVDVSETQNCQSSLADEINKGLSLLDSSAVLEWPKRCQKDAIERDITKGLKLHRKRCNSFLDDDDAAKFPSTSDVNNPNDVRSGCSGGMWDPAGCSNYLSWDPFDSAVCQICSIDKDDNQVVICDNCHNGFHMYCVRPVMVNIPKGDWFCNECSSRSNARVSFDKFSASITNTEVFRYLGLPYNTPRDFFRIHSNAIDISSLNSPKAVKQYAAGNLVPAKDAVFGIQNIKFNRNVDKNDWCLPMPLTDEQNYMLSLLSIVAAMKYCEMQSNLDDLTYEGSVKPNMNDPSIEVNEISPMSKRNIEIFRAFEHNIRQGVFPPIQIVHDEEFGFSVKALACMQRHTLIAQYLGEVVTMEQSSQSSSDSLMVLLDSGDPSTSLIIDPTRVGNFARFLSGINNGKIESKRKINVRTLRFVMDGKLRVCLFTSRRVEAGEILKYDYNAGQEGKDILQWTRLGFYDTSNFF